MDLSPKSLLKFLEDTTSKITSDYKDRPVLKFLTGVQKNLEKIVKVIDAVLKKKGVDVAKTIIDVKTKGKTLYDKAKKSIDENGVMDTLNKGYQNTKTKLLEKFTSDTEKGNGPPESKGMFGKLIESGKEKLGGIGTVMSTVPMTQKKLNDQNKPKHKPGDKLDKLIAAAANTHDIMTNPGLAITYKLMDLIAARKDKKKPKPTSQPRDTNWITKEANREAARKQEVEDEKKQVAEAGKKKKDDGGGWLGKILGGMAKLGTSLITGLGRLLFSGLKTFGGSIVSGLLKSVLGGGLLSGGLSKGLQGVAGKVVGGALSGAGKMAWSGLKYVATNPLKTLGSVARIVNNPLTRAMGMTAVRGAGTLLSGPVGWAIAAGTVGYYGYKFLKNYLKDPIYEKITRLRMLSYGLDETNKELFSKVCDLEGVMKDQTKFINYTVKIQKLDTDTVDKILSIFGVDRADKDKFSVFNKWFSQRFLPAYMKCTQALWLVNNNVFFDNIDELKRYSELDSFMSKYQLDSRVFDCTAIPNFDNPITSVTRQDFDTMFTNVQNEIKKKAPNDQSAVDKAKAENKAQSDKKAAEGEVKKKEEASKPLNKALTQATRPTADLNQKTNNQNTDLTKEGEDKQPPPNSNEATTALGSKVAGKMKMAQGDLVPGNGNLEAIKTNLDKERLLKLDPALLELFTGMAKEYNNLTGKEIPVTEAFRTFQDQEALYRSKPQFAAKPGTSMHEFGLAVDVSGETVKELNNLGLLRKYGFSTSVGGEDWHLEPIGVSLDPKRAKTDIAFRQAAIAASPKHGGDGYGLLPNSVLKQRDIDYQKSIFASTNTEEVSPDKAQTVEKKDTAVIPNVDQATSTKANIPTTSQTTGSSLKPTLTKLTSDQSSRKAPAQVTSMKSGRPVFTAKTTETKPIPIEDSDVVASELSPIEPGDLSGFNSALSNDTTEVEPTPPKVSEKSETLTKTPVPDKPVIDNKLINKVTDKELPDGPTNWKPGDDPLKFKWKIATKRYITEKEIAEELKRQKNARYVSHAVMSGGELVNEDREVTPKDLKAIYISAFGDDYEKDPNFKTIPPKQLLDEFQRKRFEYNKILARSKTQPDKLNRIDVDGTAQAIKWIDDFKKFNPEFTSLMEGKMDYDRPNDPGAPKSNPSEESSNATTISDTANTKPEIVPQTSSALETTKTPIKNEPVIDNKITEELPDAPVAKPTILPGKDWKPGDNPFKYDWGVNKDTLLKIYNNDSYNRQLEGKPYALKEQWQRNPVEIIEAYKERKKQYDDYRENGVGSGFFRARAAKIDAFENTNLDDTWTRDNYHEKKSDGEVKPSTGSSIMDTIQDSVIKTSDYLKGASALPELKPVVNESPVESTKEEPSKKTTPTPSTNITTESGIAVDSGGSKSDTGVMVSPFDHKPAAPRLSVTKPAISNKPQSEMTGPLRTEKKPDTVPGIGTNMDVGQMTNLSPEQAIVQASKIVGVNPDTMKAFAKIESNMNPQAKSRGSSAAGLFQITNDTWKELINKYAKQFGIPLTADRFNAFYNALMGAVYAKNNLEAVSNYKEANVDETSAMYAAHFLGPNGARKLFSVAKENSEAPITDVVTDSAYNANKSFMAGKTVGGFIEAIKQKVQAAGGSTTSSVASNETPTTTPSKTPAKLTGTSTGRPSGMSSSIASSSSLSRPSNMGQMNTLGPNASYTPPPTSATKPPVFNTSGMEKIMGDQLTTLSKIVEILSSIHGKVNLDKVAAVLQEKQNSVSQSAPVEPSSPKSATPTPPTQTTGYKFSQNAVDLSRKSLKI